MPNRVMIDVPITVIPRVIIKDLAENEEICPTCRGLGVVLSPNRYGLPDEHKSLHEYFPYRNEAFRYCPTCINGVVRLCVYCRMPITSGYGCQCPDAKAEKAAERVREREARWEKSSKITYRMACDRYNVLYLDDCEEFVSSDNVLDVVRDYAARKINPVIVKHIYGTERTRIAFNANQIIEDACEDLHDDAQDSICLMATDEMQRFLDRWADQHGDGTVTYWPDYSVGVILESEAAR